jgi:hypothetical protein
MAAVAPATAMAAPHLLDVALLETERLEALQRPGRGGGLRGAVRQANGCRSTRQRQQQSAMHFSVPPWTYSRMWAGMSGAFLAICGQSCRLCVRSLHIRFSDMNEK